MHKQTGTETFDDILIRSDFPAGAGVNFMQVSPDNFCFEIPADPDNHPQIKGYDYYFCVQVENRSAAMRSISLDAMRPGYQSRQVERHPSKVPVFVSADLKSWYVLDHVQASPNHHEYGCQIALSPGQAVYVSNSIPYPSRAMARWLRGIYTDHPKLAQLVCIGKSVEGREILLLSITNPGDSDKDRLLVTSGLHPAEADWLATTTIIEALLSEAAWAKRIRENFVVDVVVQPNPDGYDLGTNACNANGINLYWDFRPHEAAASPEAHHLWRWVETHPPVIYLDFHAYVYQLHKDYKPYLRPHTDYARPLRPMVRAIDRGLLDLCDGRAVRGANTYLPSTLAAQLTDAFGTVTYPKFHLHLNHGIPACRHLGLSVFRTIVDIAYRYRPLMPKTSPPGEPAGIFERGLFWWEHSRTEERFRRLKKWVRRKLGKSGMAKSTLTQHTAPGLRPHWHTHLWSQRERVEPVIITGD